MGVTKRNRIRNIQIKKELNIIPFSEEIEKNKLQWHGHVMRMDEEKKPKNLHWQPTDKRAVGRQGKRWIEGVERALERRETSHQEVENNNKFENRFIKDSAADK